jgi:hypothetical protein
MVSALVCSLVLAAPATYDVSLRSEVRGTPEGTTEVQFNPSVSLEAPVPGHFSLLGSYTPRIVLFEALAPTATYLHRGRVASFWRAAKGTRLVLDEQLLYGLSSFSWLQTAAEGGAPTFDRLAKVPPLNYFSTSTSFGIEQALSRKVGLGLSAAYLVSGGADAAARAIVPIQRGPRLALRVAWAFATQDSLLGALDAYASSYSSIQTSYVADANVGWRHVFSRVMDFDMGAGVAVSREKFADSSSSSLYPYFGAGIRRGILEKRGGQYLAGSLRVRLAPAVDPLTGIVYARADLFGNIDYSPIRKLTLAVGGGGSRGLSGVLRGDTLGFAQAYANYELSKHFSVTAGTRAVWLPYFQWANFLAISVADHGHL